MFEFLNKNKKIGLDEALQKGFITKEEFLRIKTDRAERALTNFLLSRTKKTKK